MSFLEYDIYYYRLSVFSRLNGYNKALVELLVQSQTHIYAIQTLVLQMCSR